MKRLTVAIVSLGSLVAFVGVTSLGGCASDPSAESDVSNATGVCAPRCDAIGSRSEGWYDCEGNLIGWAQCAECTAVCDAIGSRSEGWYSSCDGTLIRWDPCGSVPEPTACVEAGGACVGLTPSNCADGEWGDAETYSCGGMLGVGCCMPPAEPTNACEEAGGECLGLSPSNCTDGEWGDADAYSCGGMVGVACCLPAA